jgi:hypothetical protein
MDLVVRGKYVMTDAREGEEGILKDGAVYILLHFIVCSFTKIYNL